MRAKRTPQGSLFTPDYPDHDRGRVLADVSGQLDRHPQFLDWVAADVNGENPSSKGRAGLTCETILRAGVLMQMERWTYRELEYHLLDSSAATRFTRIDPLAPPKRSALNRCISTVRPGTWERINRVLLGVARDERIEDGSVIRIDGTVTETHIHRPSDSTLLLDSVRVLSRLLAGARKKLGREAFRFHDHERAAKRRVLAIRKARRPKRVELYRQLLATTRRTLGYVDGAFEAVEQLDEAWLANWRAKVEQYRELAEQVVSQTVRRVLEGEKVPAREKVSSLFEPHTDIVEKSGRKVQHGHKLNITSGRSGMVSDMAIEEGNPADSTRCLPMIKRSAEIYGSAPKQVACDGGYASKANLAAAKELGVRDVVFHKRRGFEVADMATTRRVYRRLRKFRAGMEAVISHLERCFGLGRCTWRGLKHFRAYAWSAVVAHNLGVMARHRLKLKPA